MEFPIYCIIFDRAVKAVRTAEGGLTVLAYFPEQDEFRREMALAHRVFSGGIETDYVSEEEFNAYVARQRAAARSRKPDASENAQ